MRGVTNVYSETATKKEPIARSARLKVARVFVERNLHRADLKAELVARAMQISVRQLHMLFEPTGMSFSRYVLARRLEQARVMLEAEPDRKVLGIVLECGIESLSVFYRGFHARFGVTPTQHRRSLRQAGSARALTRSAWPDSTGKSAAG
jgi:AraC-like DNA-binding protein